MADPPPAAPESRVIRVFLSSTFRDFMEERDLLVKQVFPELRRKARERGVEVVEVDLRWGITEEESRQGKVLPICLAEINRCRPYFVGMLGERYGWVPPDDDDNRVVLAEEPWVEKHLGRRSVTEMEILHGVLNNPEMAGRAFFYFRDPAWSRKQREPGFVCDNDEEAEKLADLKQRIRDSGFPVVEKDLPDPETLARRIGEDLWVLIEEQFPEIDQPDALEREERKHASYRRARTDLYEDGGTACVKVSQLEQWIATGEQRILITGESGAGKSALIANWMQRHQQSHPDDVVFAHHLGCSNDANALEPMLARMVQTASKLMANELSDPIKVPQDYWELVSTVTDTLSKLSFWCKQKDRRWIWVLDGLDRLPDEDQQALPWLPLQLFPHLHVVISALDGQARTILQEREYTTLTIGPLEVAEQKALIVSTMRRYNKTLIPELEEKILKHEPARSPLFLRVVLDELRVCGRHETLAQQLDDYVKAQSVDALYAKVLERLEGDVGREPVQKVMTALWASRAGLSETELLGITKVKRLQWAPIDLGLEGSFGRNGNRLVFDHDYLRQAVKERYLTTEEMQREEHSRIADYFDSRDEWGTRDSEELPWQLIQADRIQELRDWLVDPTALVSLAEDLTDREIIDFWTAANRGHEEELDEAIINAVEEEIERMEDSPSQLVLFLDAIAGLLREAGLNRKILIGLRRLSVEVTRRIDSGSDTQQPRISADSRSYDLSGFTDYAKQRYSSHSPVVFTRQELERLQFLAETCMAAGDYESSQKLFVDCVHGWQSLLGWETIETFEALSGLADSSSVNGFTDWAETFYGKALKMIRALRGKNHPDTVNVMANMAINYRRQEKYRVAEQLSRNCCKAYEQILGRENDSTLSALNSLGVTLARQGKHNEALRCYESCLEIRTRRFGRRHPAALALLANIGKLYIRIDNPEAATKTLHEALRIGSAIYGADSTLMIEAATSLLIAVSMVKRKKNSESSLFKTFELALEGTGLSRDSMYECIAQVADYLVEAEVFGIGIVEVEDFLRGCIGIHGSSNSFTTAGICRLATFLSEQCRYAEAIDLRLIELTLRREQYGDLDASTLISINSLADDLNASGDPEAAEPLYRECLAGRIEVLGEEHPDSMASRYDLAGCLSALERYDEAIELRRIELAWCEKENGPDDPDTLFSLHMLGVDLVDAEQPEAGLELLQDCLKRQQQLFGTTHERTLSTFARVLDALSDLERHAEAIALSESVQQALEADRGTKDPEVLNQISNQALLHERLEQLEVAERLWRRCLEGHERCLQSDDASMLRCIKRLARVLFQLDKSGEAESLYRRALSIQKDSLGLNHPEALSTAYDLAEVLSQQQRHAEAIPLRRRELTWCREQNGDTDPGTLASINALAIDLRETGELEEAEALFRELVSARQQVLEPEDFEIGLALGGLAKTLEEAGKLEEALTYSQQALEHRLTHEGPDAWWTNRERLDLARVLDKLGCISEATALLQELMASMGHNDDPGEADRQLISDAEELMRAIEEP